MTATTTITTAQKAQAIISELGQEFYERTDALEMLMVGIFSGEHVFWLGEPGIAKSALARAGTARFTGAKYFEVLLDKQLPKEELFGAIDIPLYDKTGEWKRKVDGYLPDAHVAFLDEVGKAGPAVLNPMLTILNERLFKANGAPKPVPLISAVGASNEELEYDELGALWDRWMLRGVLEPIQEPGNFAKLLQSAVTKPQAPASFTTIDLAELEHARNIEVPAVQLPPGVIDTVLQLKADLRGEQVRPSDRRWKKAMRLLQANAYINGRSAADEDDLAILRHVLWDVVEQIPVVERKVLSLTSPLTRAALEFQTMVDEINAGIDARKGQSVANRAEYGGEAQAKVSELTKRLNDTIEKANRQGRSTTKLDTVRDALRATKVRIFVECLNMPQDAAQRAVGA